MSRPAPPSGHSRPADASPPAPRGPSGFRPPGSVPGAPAWRGGEGRRRVLQVLAVPVVSVVVYFAVRPAVGSDAAGLAIAGAFPAAYAIVAVVVRRRAEWWSAATAVGYALACLASLLAGGSSLPLKLHEAAVTFLLGVVLLGTVLARHPLPVSRILKVPRAGQAVDASLSVMVGGFLVLHALLQLALALTLSTSAFLTAGRAVSWATIAVGALCLYGYLRRLRKDQAGNQAGPAEPPGQEGRQS